MTAKYPEMQDLATRAFNLSGCNTHAEFCGLFGDAVGLSTFRKWLGGSHPGSPLAALMLREFIAGWRPTCVS